MAPKSKYQFDLLVLLFMAIRDTSKPFVVEITFDPSYLVTFLLFLHALFIDFFLNLNSLSLWTSSSNVGIIFQSGPPSHKQKIDSMYGYIKVYQISFA